MRAHLPSTELQLRWCAWWHFVTSCNGSLRTTISFVIDYRIYKRTFSAHSEWAATKNEWIKALKIPSCARRQTVENSVDNARFLPRGETSLASSPRGLMGSIATSFLGTRDIPLGVLDQTKRLVFMITITAHNIMYLACGGRWIFAPVTRTGIDIPTIATTSQNFGRRNDRNPDTTQNK